MTTRRKLLTLLGLASLVLHGAPTYAAAPLTLVVGDQFFSNRIVLELSGELKDLPYTIDFKRFNTGSPVASAVASGALDIGVVGDTPVISLAANGAPVKVVASTQTSLNGVGIVARPGIQSVADLKGKTVAIWNGSSRNFAPWTRPAGSQAVWPPWDSSLATASRLLETTGRTCIWLSWLCRLCASSTAAPVLVRRWASSAA